MCHNHGWAQVWFLPPRGEPRCAFCGHRLPINGVPPRETRKYPLRTWIPELLARRRAIRSTDRWFPTVEEWETMMNPSKDV